MKNFLISLIMILVLSLSTSAQNNSKTKIRIGALAGMNLADIKSNSIQDKNTNIAPVFGLTSEFPVTNSLSLKVELMYLNKGAKLMAGKDPIEEPEAHLKSNYLELPVLVKYSFFEGINPYLMTGMVFGYQLNTELDVIFPGLETTVEMKNVTEKFELGVCFGGGLEIPLNSLNLFLDCKYTIGLTNMQQTGSVTVDVGGVQIPIDYDKDENGYKNRGIQLLLGITIPIK